VTPPESTHAAQSTEVGNAGPVVHGIDFGTSTSMIMIGRPGVAPLLIRDPLAAQGEVGVPTSVCLRRDGTLAVGFEAERMKELHIRDYRSGFKLEMGQPVGHRLGTVDYSPDQLMTEVVRCLRDWARQVAPQEPDLVLVTVPAGWESWTRDLATAACAAAGYDVTRVRLEAEPVAAIAGPHAVSGTTLVYDLGGGTFDCTVAIDSGTGPQIYGRPSGLPTIGGRLFDERILRHLRDTFPAAEKLFVSDPDDAVLRNRIQLREKCTRAKIGLSVTDPHEDLLAELDPPEILELDRATLAVLIGDLLDRTLEECDRLLGELGLSWQDLTRCVLVGGSTRMPLVRERLSLRCGERITVLPEPELAVVRGATVLALARLATQREPPAPDTEPCPEDREPGPSSNPGPEVMVPPVGPGGGLRVFDPVRNLFDEH
jgi:molecular chaperone DnaK (HSP70)